MNVLIIGSGGREHAMAWKIAQSPRLTRLFIAPGNPGTARVGQNIDVNPLDFNALKGAVLAHAIGLVVVGSEEPLVLGLHDFFLADPQLRPIPVIGPTRAGAMLEGSKDFAKAFMVRHGIPTARYMSFTARRRADAHRYLDTLTPPYVLKADGLAAGKGVIICGALAEAKAHLEDFFQGKFGSAGHTVVIEEYLHGIELSAFVLTDGSSYVMLPEAKDYKRIGEADTGPNTGGMGAVSPVPFATPEFMHRVEELVVIPTIIGLKAEGIPYRGFIFLGLINVNGHPKVIEYNVRLGDPETQAVLPRIASDFLELLMLTAQNRLSSAKIQLHGQTASAVVLVSGGYPNHYPKGLPIALPAETGAAMLFHAGTRNEGSNGQLVTWGGRVLAAVGMGDSMALALDEAYRLARAVEFEGKYFRSDIGRDLREPR